MPRSTFTAVSQPHVTPKLATTLTLTGLALAAFAANSLLSRQALGSGHIDPIGFTVVRLISGAVILVVLVGCTRGFRSVSASGSWRAAATLLVYAVAFSFAYLSLDAGMGALILFASVQITMVSVSVRAGQRPSSMEWLGMAVAAAGLVALLSPGLTAPPFVGAALMALSGVAWGAYCLLGRQSDNPSADTAGNFLRTAPLILLIALPFLPRIGGDLIGIWLAVASGAVASGIGYAVWYAALRRLTASTAATVQLSVPALAACGGIFFLDEALTLRLSIAATLILGGVALSIQAQNAMTETPPRNA